MTTRQPPLRIGLTGGIGSGKSTVSHMLQARGAAVVDADAIARGLTAPQGAAMAAIARTFGAAFVTPEGALNREHMRAHVFSEAKAKEALEAIIHPLVAQEIQQQAQAALHAGYLTLVFDVPLLIEAGTRWRAQVDRVWVVDCLVETQIQRVVARSGLSPEAVQKIIATQSSRAKKLRAADWVIYNEGLTKEALQEAVDQLPIRTLEAH